MEPTAEIRAPVRAENKIPVIATLKSKSAEVAKKVLPERTRRWLTEATSHLQRGNGRKALETISIPPKDPSIPKEPKTVSKEEPGKSPAAETKDTGKTPTATSSSRETEDVKDEEMAMGMRKTEEKKDATEVKPPPSETAKQQVEPTKVNEETLIPEDLINAGNVINTLLQQKENPKAQLAAMILISDGYYAFNLRDGKCIDQLAVADIRSTSQTLGLKQDTIATMETKRHTLIDVHKQYTEMFEQQQRTMEKRDEFMIPENKKIQLQEQLNNYSNQVNQLEIERERMYRELMLPIRTAVLSSETLPDIYKRHVIAGIKGGDGNPLPEENSLLKQTYSTGSERIKIQITDTVLDNIGHDINSFDVIPINDFKRADIDTMFIATLGNLQTTGEFVETRVAPAFFPDESPAKVRQCYEVLKKVSGYENSYGRTGFYHDTKSMNVNFFKNFMDNSESLIPVVDMLSDYGFNYQPCDSLEGKFSQQYVEILKDLAQNLTQLRTELDSIKVIMPDYKYIYKIDTRYRDSKLERERESFIDDNPFALALKQKIYYPSKIDTLAKANETAQFFESLQKVVPDRWRDGFISTYIEMMSTAAGWPDRPSDVTRKAISEANKYIFDPSLTPDQVELFATKFFGSSLDARNENTEIAVKFCERYADKIRTWTYGQEHVDADATWYTLSSLSADLYRYPIVAGKEDTAITKAKTDLMYACEAVHKIKDPIIKDKAISNLIFPLTDEEIGDVEKAQIYVDMIRDDVLKKDAQVEIELEKERSEKGETTTWKKMEKVRRSSPENEKFLRDIFGFGNSSEELLKAREQYSQQFHRSPDYYGTFSPENQAKLEQEIARIRGDYHVTLNITWANVLGTLETGQVISAWENPEVMEYRNKYGKYNYEERRNQIERLLGNRAKGGMKDPHPLYGAAASPNNRDEFYGGTGGGYGECFFVLKTDRIKDRTSFVYDDSFGLYNRWTLDWEDGITAKAIHNLNSSQSMHGYVEAEILGGVSIEDIDSINIPSDAISGKENKYRQSTGTDISLKIDQLRQKYPNVKINIIQVPTT